MNCMFCSVTAFNGARYRQRSIPEVVREFQSIPEKRVLVVDDNLIGTRPEHIARAKDLFRALAAAPCMSCSVKAFNAPATRQRSIPEVNFEFQTIPEKRAGGGRQPDRHPARAHRARQGLVPSTRGLQVGALVHGSCAWVRLLCLGTVGNRRFPGHLDGRRRTIST